MKTLADLSQHDWHIVSHTWARGIDWIVEKRGSRWKALDLFLTPGLHRSKKAAYEAATAAVLAESHRRAS